MVYRVVIPRSIPFADSNRVQKAVWRSGYSTRLAGRDAADPSRQVVEFLRTVDDLPDAAAMPQAEQALEALLSGTRIHAPFAGRGGWVETVQNRPVRRGIA